MTVKEWALYLLTGFLLTFLAVGTLSVCSRMGPLWNVGQEAPVETPNPQNQPGLPPR